MMELNTLVLNKITLNSGYIFFDNKGKAKKAKELLEKLNIGFTLFVVHDSNNKYYGFKVFRMRKQLFKLCAGLKEIMDEELYQNYISNDIAVTNEFLDSNGI